MSIIERFKRSRKSNLISTSSNILKRISTGVIRRQPNINKVSNNLWQFENALNKGLKNGKYYPHTTPNGSLDVANGIDLNENPLFINEAKKGITKKRANEISSSILGLELPYINKVLSKYTTKPDTISPLIKEGLLDMYWQAGNGLYEYKNLMKEIAIGNLPLILEESKMYYKTKDGEKKLDERRWNLRKDYYFHY